MSLLQHHLCVPVKFLWSTALKRTGLPGIKKKKKRLGRPLKKPIQFCNPSTNKNNVSTNKILALLNLSLNTAHCIP